MYSKSIMSQHGHPIHRLRRGRAGQQTFKGIASSLVTEVFLVTSVGDVLRIITDQAIALKRDLEPAVLIDDLLA